MNVGDAQMISSKSLGWNTIALEWMRHVAQDYRKYAQTFGLSIICPEKWNAKLPVSKEKQAASTDPCGNQGEALGIMYGIDPELEPMITFFNTPASEMTEEMLPPKYREILSAVEALTAKKKPRRSELSVQSSIVDSTIENNRKTQNYLLFFSIV